MISIPIVALVYDRYHKASVNKEAAVEIRISYERRQKYMSTGIRLKPKQWRNGTVTNRTDAIVINQQLDQLVADVRQVILEMQKEGHIDIFAIPGRLKKKKADVMSFLEYIEKQAKVRVYGKAKGTKQRYRLFINFLNTWGKITQFSDITEANVILLDEELVKRKLKSSSKWTNYHRFLNSFILDAIRDGYLSRNPYNFVDVEKDRGFSGNTRYLTPEEFDKVRTAELPGESLQRVRDLFVFQTYTCLSFSDLVSFDARKIQTVKGVKVYVGNRKKTKESFTIPLLSPALQILQKYNNKLPILSDQKYNAYLKAVAQHAGVDKPLSSHWARHTGATLLLNNGVDMKIVSKICGHSSTKITEQVYAKLLDETVVDAVMDKNF